MKRLTVIVRIVSLVLLTSCATSIKEPSKDEIANSKNIKLLNMSDQVPQNCTKSGDFEINSNDRKKTSPQIETMRKYPSSNLVKHIGGGTHPIGIMIGEAHFDYFEVFNCN